MSVVAFSCTGFCRKYSRMSSLYKIANVQVLAWKNPLSRQYWKYKAFVCYFKILNKLTMPTYIHIFFEKITFRRFLSVTKLVSFIMLPWGENFHEWEWKNNKKKYTSFPNHVTSSLRLMTVPSSFVNASELIDK